MSTPKKSATKGKIANVVKGPAKNGGMSPAPKPKKSK